MISPITSASFSTKLNPGTHIAGTGTSNRESLVIKGVLMRFEKIISLVYPAFFGYSEQ